MYVLVSYCNRNSENSKRKKYTFFTICSKIFKFLKNSNIGNLFFLKKNI